jgi:CDP-diacylglycerol--serine O-phosphatidyltransferase
MTDHEIATPRPEGARGTICLLPSLLTTVSLFSGFYAIISAINGLYLYSAVAIVVSGVFDGLDGRVARMTGTASLFGKEYDSLCDLVAFGVAPAIVAYLWAMKTYGRFGWLAAFLYVATTALRLARFNTQDSGSKDFTGLPCPAAAGTIATSIMFCDFFKVGASAIGLSVLAMVYVLSYLMVSSIKYLSFKHPETTRARKFQMMVAMVLLLMVIATEPQVTLFIIGVLYVLSGPVSGMYRLLVPASQALEDQEKPVLRR